MRIAAAVLLLAAAVRAGPDVVELTCPADVQYRVVRDVDNDGRDDLLLVTPHWVWVWRGGPAPPKAKPDARLKLPEGASLFHVERPLGFIARAPRSYWALGLRTPPAELRGAGPGLPDNVSNVLWRKLFTDLDGDGKADFVDVSLDGYRVQFGDGTEVLLPPALAETADTQADAASDRLLARIAFARWHAGDFDGDGLTDFGVMTARGLRVYSGDERRRFAPGRVLEIDLEEAVGAELTLHDFNGDGHTDLLAVHKDSGRATVLLGRPEKGLRDARAIRLTVPGQLRDTIVSDFDGDGRPDLALPFVPKLGFQDILRVVARREVRIQVPLFLNRGGMKVFGARADQQVSLPVRIRVKTDSIGRLLLSGLVVVEHEGDIDGDGRRDLVVTETPRRLAVHRGVPGKLIEEQPSGHIRIPDCSGFESVRSVAGDLNGNGSSDIILHYRGAGKRPDRLFVLWSRKK